ncbi:MAG TPA: phosphoribosyltransferase family protein [Chitinophagaceae bacterium]|nr:phosphoribosyltransferase family protein [Chitinophagaceae bacterium]
MAEKRYVLNTEAAAQKLHRMALEIAEQLSGDNTTVILIGVRNSGTGIAEIIAGFAKPFLTGGIRVISVSLDKHNPGNVVLSEDIDLNGKNVIVIDDVCNSGRTLMYALKPLLAFSPKRIQTLVLVERMHKSFPVKPDYVGSSVATTSEDFIQVELENGVVKGAYIA